MYLGKVVEEAPPERLFGTASHPYTRVLLAVAPNLSRRRLPDAAISGDVPSAADAPSGCAFRSRCQFATDRCANEVPERRIVGPGHWVSCHNWESLPAVAA
jgi:oligopeptide/dipeptide ABC transporter ATP-binding protein